MNRSDWTHHPYEIALVGYQNSGKTTLAAKLVPLLGLELAYLKRDARRFDMDKPGKDTHTLADAGAAVVAISDPAHRAAIGRGLANPVLGRLDFLEQDALLLEGHKPCPVPTILVLDQELAIAADPAFRAQTPLAVAGPWASPPPLPWPVPYFCRDDTPAVAEFIRAFWDGLTAQIPLLGLVLTGAGVPPGGGGAQRVFGLLEEFCSQVFVSCPDDLAGLADRSGLPQIRDTLLGRGPLSGILSAFEARPDAAWLVAACDLPRLDQGAVTALAAGRNPLKFATAFRGADGLPEPLCALYEPKAGPRLWQFVAAGCFSPRKALIHSPVELLDHREEGTHDFGS